MRWFRSHAAPRRRLARLTRRRERPSRLGSGRAGRPAPHRRLRALRALRALQVGALAALFWLCRGAAAPLPRGAFASPSSGWGRAVVAVHQPARLRPPAGAAGRTGRGLAGAFLASYYALALGLAARWSTGPWRWPALVGALAAGGAGARELVQRLPLDRLGLCPRGWPARRLGALGGRLRPRAAGGGDGIPALPAVGASVCWPCWALARGSGAAAKLHHPDRHHAPLAGPAQHPAGPEV